MANALEAASLVMIPSGYEDGTLGSLKPTDGSGDFTFTRGSNLSATRVGPNGYIEKGYENLLYPSNNLASLCNNNFRGTTADSNQIANPINGEVTADKFRTLVSDAPENRARISNYIQSGVQTISLYAKYIDYKYIYIRQLASSVNQEAIFDIELGEITFDALLIESKIEPAGDGWYRCSITFNASSISNNLIDIGLSASATSFRGDIQDGVSVYFFGYMLNQGLVAYPYIETTTAPVAGGILEDMPRLDWSGSCPALLLEPSRTNLIDNSEYFGTSDWRKTDLSVTTNYDISPEGFKNATRVQLSNLSNARLDYDIGSTPTEENIVFSCWYKGTAGEKTFMRVNGANSGSVYKLITFTGNWQKESIAHTRSSSFNFVYPVDTRGGTEDNATDFLIYGAQAEKDATYETSYIPTYGVSQTRLADSVTDAGDVNTFNSTEGVLYAELSFVNDNSFKSLSLNSGSSTNRVMLYSSNPSYVGVNIRNVSGNQFNGTFFIDATINHKIAVKYKENDFALWIDGQKRLSDLSGTTFSPSTLTQLDFDDANGSSPLYGALKQIILFPTALSDSECIALTTI